jgi:hypothetical protein
MYDISVVTGIGSLETYGKFIPRYLENVLEQETFSRTEHIIVYSEEGEYLDLFRTHKNFKLVKENEKLGVYNAWNIGIQNSSAKYITNWNIDDLRHPNNNKLKFDLLESNPEYSLVYNYYVATNDENETFYTIDSSNKTIILFPDHFEKYAMVACLCGPDPMWRTEIHSKIGYFDYKNYPTIGDWEMWVRMAKSGVKFKLIPEILCIYLDHDNTVSKTNNDTVHQEIYKLRKQYSEFRTEHYNIMTYKL